MAGIKFDITGDNKNVLDAFKGVQQGVRQTQNVVEKNGQSIESLFNRIKDSALGGFKSIASGLAGLTALVESGNFIKTLYEDMGKFSKAMKEVSTLSQDVTEHMTEYKNQVVELCTQIAIAPEEAAKALYQIESAGHHGADGMNVLEQAAKGAIGGVTETEVAADAITTILNSYKMKAEEAAHVNDLLFTTVRLGKTTYGELGQVIAQVTPVAAAYGVAIEDVLAAIASLTKSGTKTGIAVRQVRDAITAATNSLGDGAFKTRSFLEAMDEVAEKTKGSESALKQDLAKLSAMNAVLALTGKNAAAAKQDLEEMKNSTGAATAAYEKMASTAGDATIRLRNNIFAYFMPLGDEIRGMSKSIAQSLNEAFDDGSAQKFLATLEAFIASYALYRGMLASANFGQSLANASHIAATNAAYDAEIAQLQTIIPLKEAEAKTDLEIAVAEGRLTPEKAELIAATRAEAQAHLQNLQAMAAEAQVRFNEATSIAANISLRLEEAEAAVATAEMKYTSAVASGNAIAIESAELELNAAIATKNGVAKELEAAREGAATAAKQMHATATAAETAATVTNTAAQGAETASTGILAGAKLKLKKAIDLVNASFLGSPLFWMAATIVGVTYAVYKLVTAETEHERAVRKANEAIDEQDKKLGERKNEIDSLVRTIQSETATEYEKIRAYNRLKEIAPQLTDEYSRQELAAMKTAEAQKELNSSLQDLDYKNAKNELDEYSKKLDQLREDFRKSSMEDAMTGSPSANTDNLRKQIAETEAIVAKLRDRLHEMNEAREQAAEDTKPIEIRIKEAEENVESMQSIKDFYDEAMNLAEHFQEANDEINYVTAQNNIDEFIQRSEAELDEMKRQIEENPTDYKLQLEYEEKKKILDGVINMKEQMRVSGATTIPLYFKMDYQSFQNAWLRANNQLNSLREQTVAGGARTLEQEFSSAQSRYNAAMKKIRDIEANRSKYTKEEYINAKSELKTAKEAYGDLGGDVSGKSSKKSAKTEKKDAERKAKEQAERNADEKAEQLRHDSEMLKIEQEGERARREAKIAAIKNDANRERAEREEQYRQSVEDIKAKQNEIYKTIYEQRKKAYERDNKGKKYENTKPGAAGWSASVMEGTLTDSEKQEFGKRFAPLEAELEKLNAENERMIRETEKDLISAHQSYIDKKIAIDEEYQEEVKKIDEAIAKAEERGDKQSVDALKRSRVEAAKQRNKEQADLSLEKLKESPEYIRAFEDLENTSTETLQIVIKNFEEAKAAAAENLDPKDFKEYTDALNQMYDELSSRDPFKAMRDSLIEVKEAHTKVKEATDKYNRIMNGEKVLVGETNKETGEFNVRLLTEEEALQDVAEAKDRESRATTKFKKASRQAKDVVDELAGAVQNVGSSIGGMVGDIISLVGDITSVVNGALHAMENTSEGASAAIQAAEKASAILAIISAALQVIQKISGIVKGLFGANDAQEFEKAKAQYENLADIWDELIEKKREYLNESWGKEVMSAAEEANRLLEVEKEQLKILARQGLDVTNGSHSMWYRMWQGSYSFNGQNWRDVAGEISKTLGVQFNSMGDMLDMSAEQLQWIKENYIGLWANMDVNFKEALEKLIQFGDTEASIVEDSLTRLTGTTADDVFNDFLENLYDLADGSEDAMDNIAENWQKMVNRMVINNLIAGKMKEQLEGWYEDLAEINKQRSKNEIGDKEYQQSLADMQQRYNNLVAEGRSQMEQFTEMGIIKPLSEASEEAKEYFTNLRDSWLSTLTDMTADGKEWKQDILRTMFEDLVDATVLDVPVTVNGQTFDDFGKYLEDWTKRYKEAVESGNIEVMKALLDEQTTFREKQAKKSKEIADSLGYEIVNEFSNSIDNLSDTFLNNLLDLNADAEDMGKEIGSTLIQEMLKQMLASEQYSNRMKEIKEHWQNALNGDEAYTYESVMAEITALNNDIANDEAIGALAAQWKELNKQVEQSKSPFSDLRSTFRGTLMSLESDAQSFADNLNNTILQDLLDKQVFSKPLTVAEKEFEDFDAYVADWNKRYLEAVENNETEAIEALITELTGVQGQLDEATKELRESLIRKEEEKTDSTFLDMTDSFVSSLMDVNSTAMDWAEDIGRTMAQKIIEQMVVAKQIQPLLDNLQKAFNTAMGAEGATWQTAVADTGVQLAMQQIKDAYPELQKLATGIMNGLGVRMEEAKEGFSDLRGTLVSTLTDMEGDAQKLGKNIGQTMIQQMLDALVEKKYAERMKTINEQWADALESGDTTKIDSVRNSVVSLYQAISNDSSVKQLADDLRELTKEAEETPLHGFRSNFLSQLMDMESDTKDFAAEINQILTEAFIDKFVLGDAFDERLAEWEKEYSKLMGDPEMSAEARAKALKQLGENIAAESETMKEQARAIQEMFNTTEYGDQQATVNMADKATYDQFEMYLGIATAQQITGEQQLGVTQQILYTLQAMSGITSPMGGMSEEMRNMWLISNQYLLDIKQSNREILNSFGLKLDSINVKLSKL